MLPPPGWYPDPQAPPGQIRYWDGARWTEHRATYGLAPAAHAPAYAPAQRSSKAWVGWVVAGVVAVGAIAVAVDDDQDPSTGSDSAVSRSESDGSDEASATQDNDAEPADSETGEPSAPPTAAAPTASAPPTSAAPAAAAPPTPKPKTYKVVSVTDGDTLRLANGEAVRLVGIDAPEEGVCGSLRAAELLTSLVEGQRVTLTAPVDDRDRYDRLLRYVNVGTMDAGLRMIKNGLAIARFDSRDGYDAHPREVVPPHGRRSPEREVRPCTAGPARGGRVLRLLAVHSVVPPGPGLRGCQRTDHGDRFGPARAGRGQRWCRLRELRGVCEPPSPTA